ncbi:unnamed protein product [Ambrosiozyma monospora]|uniref:Unnamed protein product n=1 Tax=Ambrosiozyma monospora TaxID=43982 RepID=A0A9W7DEH6_AMBMO|nr:unnamed protein product [Ambrosiozyma monospora]
MNEDLSAIEERVKAILLKSKAKIQATRSPLASQRITQHLMGRRIVPRSSRNSLPLKRRKFGQSFKPDANKSDSSIKVNGDDSTIIEPKDETKTVKQDDDCSLALQRLEIGWSRLHISLIREFQKQKEAKSGFTVLLSNVDRMLHSLKEMKSSTSYILADKPKHKEHNKTEAKMILFDDLAKKYETKGETASAYGLVELHNDIFDEHPANDTEFDKFFESLWVSTTEPWYEVHEKLSKKIDSFKTTLEKLKDLMNSEETSSTR